MNLFFQGRNSIRAGRKASLARPWDDFNYCVIDVETTGLDPKRDGIISFGSVPILDGRISPRHGTQFLVNPGCTVGVDAVKIHSIRNEDLRDSPTIGTHLTDITEAVRGKIVVAHSAWVEEDFLSRAFGRRNLPFTLPIIDTAQMALPVMDLPHLGRADVSLEFLSQALGLPTHTPHDALSDAMTTAQVFLALASRLCRQAPLTLGDLLRMSAARRQNHGFGTLGGAR